MSPPCGSRELVSSRLVFPFPPKNTPCRECLFGAPGEVLPIPLKGNSRQSVAALRLARTREFSPRFPVPTKKHPLSGVSFWCTRRGSNSQRGRRRPLFYPIRLRVHILFFKKHIYFTIFCFAFASVYGIIFSNS